MFSLNQGCPTVIRAFNNAQAGSQHPSMYAQFCVNTVRYTSCVYANSAGLQENETTSIWWSWAGLTLRHVQGNEHKTVQVAINLSLPKIQGVVVINFV